MITSPPELCDPRTEVTSLLAQMGANDPDAESRLIELVFGDLRRMARRHLARERRNHTLQPTALVNEAYLRLANSPHDSWENKAHFFATASRLMRHVLVDYGRNRNAEKRGGLRLQVTLKEDLVRARSFSVDILALDEALEKLTQLDARQARIVELHFFGGMGFEDIARLLGVSDRTVKGDWGMARAWLKGVLAGKV
jgi:RNA polymerase sigma factor (TIGR02999 family)